MILFSPAYSSLHVVVAFLMIQNIAVVAYPFLSIAFIAYSFFQAGPVA